MASKQGQKLAAFRPGSPPEQYSRRDVAYFRAEVERAFAQLASQLEGVQVLSTVNADTTPSVARGRVFTVANTGATTITTFDDATPGETYTFIFSDGNTTVQDGANLHLSGGVNFISTADDVLVLVYDGTSFYEVSRSTN